MLGIAGTPGVGKSYFTEWLSTQFPGGATIVPFDGFHLSNELLAAKGLAQVKGHIDTFDLPGFRSLLQRLRSQDEDVVYAPKYVRDIEESVGSAVEIPRDAQVLIVEGNYLLADHPDLARSRECLDEVWYLETDDETRVKRLIQRHIQFGKSAQAARDWVMNSDEANAAFIRSTRHRADYVVAYSESLLDTGNEESTTSA